MLRPSAWIWQRTASSWRWPTQQHRVQRRERLSRGQFQRFFGNFPACRIVMEACGSAHHWARTLQAARPRGASCSRRSTCVPTSNATRPMPNGSWLIRPVSVAIGRCYAFELESIVPLSTQAVKVLGLNDARTRCPWCLPERRLRAYHDEEWGVPVHDDRKLFEFLILEGAQAGLSWSTILNKREGYREAFAGFDPEKVARFGERESSGCCSTRASCATGSRSRARSRNARGVPRRAGGVRQLRRVPLELRRRPADRQPAAPIKRGARRPRRESDALSKDLKRRGFKFVGSTISTRSCRRPAWSTTTS